MTTLDKLRSDLLNDKAELAILEAKHNDFKAEFRRRRKEFSDQLKIEMIAERGQIKQLVAIYKKKIEMAENLVSSYALASSYSETATVSNFDSSSTVTDSNAGQENTSTVAGDQEGRIF